MIVCERYIKTKLLKCSKTRLENKNKRRNNCAVAWSEEIKPKSIFSDRVNKLHIFK